MEAPMCLIESIDGEKLRINQEALQILQRIHQPVVVVSIVGPYRMGKSYLMNRLAGKRTGFSVECEMQAHTKGIWMWCLPYPDRKDQTLVLLDTEGLEDVNKADKKAEIWIFALAILLSSTLIYNSKGTIDQSAMDKLHYVTELTKRIKAKASPGDSAGGGLENSVEYLGYFPDFIWALRDVTLQLKLNGKPITEDEYLENALKLKQGPKPAQWIFAFEKDSETDPSGPDLKEYTSVGLLISFSESLDCMAQVYFGLFCKDFPTAPSVAVPTALH